MRGCYPAQIHVVSKSGTGKLIKYHQFVRHAWRPQNVAPSTPTKTVGDRPCIHDVPATAAAPKPNYPRAAAPRWLKNGESSWYKSPANSAYYYFKVSDPTSCLRPNRAFINFLQFKDQRSSNSLICCDWNLRACIASNSG